MGKTSTQVRYEAGAAEAMPSLTSRHRHGRAVNAVAGFLRSQLRVPNVYISPSVHGNPSIDVLAADAAGSGDIYVAEVKFPIWVGMSESEFGPYFERLKRIPVHFKYLALPKNEITVSALASPKTFSTDGIGRIGVLFISEAGGMAPTVELAVKAERFKVDADKLARIERFLERAKPDMYVRV